MNIKNWAVGLGLTSIVAGGIVVNKAITQNNAEDIINNKGLDDDTFIKNYDSTKVYTYPVKGKDTNVKIEAGVMFENNGSVYKVEQDGTLKIKDKNTNTWSTGTELNMTKYQISVFKNIANNFKEPGSSEEEILLSRQDINRTFFPNAKLEEDISQNLPEGYKIEKATTYIDNQTVQVDVHNEVKDEQAALLTFHYGNNPMVPDVTSTTTPITTTSPTKALTKTDNLFNHPKIIKTPAQLYTVERDDDIVGIAKKFKVDTYSLVAANPQLKYQVIHQTKIKTKNGKFVYKDDENPKEGMDIIVRSRDYNLANLSSKLKAGTVLTIPEVYDIQKGSVTSAKDVAEVTGIDETYISKVLTPNEELHLEPYKDGGGTLTIAWGHIGDVDGQPITMSMDPITIEKAYELLAKDLLDIKQRDVLYFGDAFLNAPRSVQSTFIDVTFNKGIFDGFMHKFHSKDLKNVKKDLEDKNYVAALIHSARNGNSYSPGLAKRNVYRFIYGLNDLPQDLRKKAIDGFDSRYKTAIHDLRNSNKNTRNGVTTAWTEAKNGNTNNFVVK